jgi:hypothetical protein
MVTSFIEAKEPKTHDLGKMTSTGSILKGVGVENHCDNQGQ